MLTMKLEVIQEDVERSRVPLWLLPYLKSATTPALKPIPPFRPLPGDPRERSVREA